MGNEVKKPGFQKGVSGNPTGRPKGSKNEITLRKLMLEEAALERNGEKMLAVIDKVVDDALDGNQNMMKLVWQSVVSKGTADLTTGKEKMTIEINTGPKEEVTVIEHPPETIEEDHDEQS